MDPSRYYHLNKVSAFCLRPCVFGVSLTDKPRIRVILARCFPENRSSLRAFRVFFFSFSLRGSGPGPGGCRFRRLSAHFFVFYSFFRGLASSESVRVISTARLNALPRLHLQPIDVIVFDDPNGDLILGGASCLDAFSTYPGQTRIPGGAPGGTTGKPEVCPTRSSRTSVRAPQISCAHNR